MSTTPDPRQDRPDDTVRHDTVDSPETQSFPERQGSPEPESRPEPTAWQAATPPEPVRPTGPSWPTIALGVLALVVAGMALTYQLVDLTVNWSIATPVAIVAAGALLVLLGLVGLLGGRGEEEPR